MLASIPASHIRYTLGAQASELVSPNTEILIMNEVQSVLESAYRWSWLEARSVPLSLRKGEPYITLPDDFRSVLAIQTNPSIVNQITLSSRDEVLRLRTTSLSDLPGYYRVFVDNAPTGAKNKLGYTEDFAVAGWTLGGTPATLTASQAVSPAGEASAAAPALLSGGAVGDSIVAAVVAAQLDDGHDYAFSVFVKQHASVPATTSTITLGQRGVGGGATSTWNPKTVGLITWTAGVPAIAASVEQGGGLHTVGVEDVEDGWYRVYCTMTWDADPAKAATDLAAFIHPETTDAAAQGIYIWGAQVEDVELHENPTPTRYDNGAATTAAVTLKQEPIRRLAVWPIPTEDMIGSFVMNYRMKMPDVETEASAIPIPRFMEPLYNELCRVYARGVHEEDEAMLSNRLAPTLQGPLFLLAKEQDDSSQSNFGQMSGTASGNMYRARNWNTQEAIPNP